MASGVQFLFKAFDPQITTWKRWVQRLETAINIGGCKDVDKQKYLLHYMGSKVYNTLCDKVLPKTPEDMTYTEITSVLEQHFHPTPKEILEIYRFHLRKQEEGKSCSEYIVVLKRMAATCNFGSYMEKALRNQFVFGLKNQLIQSRLLEKADLILESAINLAEAAEMAEKGGVELNTNTYNAINVVKTFKKRPEAANKAKEEKRQKQCYRCGSTTHIAYQCKHSDTICSFCKIKGHLRRVCMKEKKGVHLLNTNEVENNDDGDMEDSHCNVELINNIRKRYVGSKMFHSLLVNNRWLKFEIDTGAAVTVVGKENAEKILGKIKLHNTNTKLYSYCNQQVDCLGYAWVQVSVGRSPITLKLHIVHGNRSALLGRDWLRSIKLNWAEIIQQQLSMNQIKKVVTNTEVNKNVEHIINKYPVLFNDTMGKINGYQARLHVQQQAVPHFVKARRVPFALNEALEKELQQQVDEGILVKVDHSDWATPIVAVKKKITRSAYAEIIKSLSIPY